MYSYVLIQFLASSEKTVLTWFCQQEDNFIYWKVYTLGGLQLNFVAGYRVLIKFNDYTVTIRSNNYAFCSFVVHVIQENLGIIPLFMSEAKPIEFPID